MVRPDLVEPLHLSLTQAALLEGSSQILTLVLPRLCMPASVSCWICASLHPAIATDYSSCLHLNATPTTPPSLVASSDTTAEFGDDAFPNALDFRHLPSIRLSRWHCGLPVAAH